MRRSIGMSLKSRVQVEYEIIEKMRKREEKRAGYEKTFLVKENNMEEVNRILRDGGRVKK